MNWRSSWLSIFALLGVIFLIAVALNRGPYPQAAAEPRVFGLFPGEKLVSAGWASSGRLGTLWILTRPMREGELPEKYDFRPAEVGIGHSHTISIHEVSASGMRDGWTIHPAGVDTKP